MRPFSADKMIWSATETTADELTIIFPVSAVSVKLSSVSPWTMTSPSILMFPVAVETFA